MALLELLFEIVTDFYLFRHLFGKKVNLSPLDAEILALISQNPKIERNDIIYNLEAPESEIDKHLKFLSSDEYKLLTLQYVYNEDFPIPTFMEYTITNQGLTALKKYQK